jgi:hypothetical protein
MITYIIEALGTGLHKIGRTDDIEQRWSGCTDTPVKLVIRAIFNSKCERELHKLFGQYVQHGEWFALPLNWKFLIPKGLDATFPDKEIDLPKPCVFFCRPRGSSGPINHFCEPNADISAHNAEQNLPIGERISNLLAKLMNSSQDPQGRAILS